MNTKGLGHHLVPAQQLELFLEKVKILLEDAEHIWELADLKCYRCHQTVK